MKLNAVLNLDIVRNFFVGIYSFCWYTIGIFFVGLKFFCWQFSRSFNSRSFKKDLFICFVTLAVNHKIYKMFFSKIAKFSLFRFLGKIFCLCKVYTLKCFEQAQKLYQANRLFWWLILLVLFLMLLGKIAKMFTFQA